MGEVRISAGGAAWRLGDDERFSFGRALDCTCTLDPDDLGISRRAGLVVADGGLWWLVNVSGVRPLLVVDDLGIEHVLAPGRRMVVDGELTVVVEGSVRRHAVVVAAGAAAPPGLDDGPAADGTVSSPADAELVTAVGGGVVLTDRDRLALLALFEGYLERFPRYDPHPRSYADAADRLGWKRTTLVKRVEYVRRRLADAGVPGLVGDTALEGLARYALTSGVVRRDDLVRLDDPLGDETPAVPGAEEDRGGVSADDPRLP